MAASAAQKGVDSTPVIFVKSTFPQFPQMDGVLKIGSADTAIVIQPFLSRITASNDGTLLAYYVRDIRPGVSGAVFRGAPGRRPTCRPSKLGALPLTRGQPTPRPIPMRRAIRRRSSLSCPRTTPIPKWSLRLTAENLAPWASIMKAQRMIHSDISLDKMIFP